MDPLLFEFRTDLQRVQRLLDLMEAIKLFPTSHSPEGEQTDAFIRQAAHIHTQAKGCHADSFVFIGTLILYLGGRFEYFVRAEFEDLCDRIARRCNSFDRLPRAM